MAELPYWIAFDFIGVPDEECLSMYLVSPLTFWQIGVWTPKYFSFTLAKVHQSQRRPSQRWSFSGAGAWAGQQQAAQQEARPAPPGSAAGSPASSRLSCSCRWAGERGSRLVHVVWKRSGCVVHICMIGSCFFSKKPLKPSCSTNCPVTYLETLLPQDTLEAWFLSLAYAWCEEWTMGGEGGGCKGSSR